MKSVYTKNSILAIMILLLSFVLTGVVFSAFSYRFIKSERRNTVDMVADAVEAAVAAKSVESELDSIDMRLTISTISSSVNAQISICDKDGVVISCSDDNIFCRHIGLKIPENILNEANRSNYRSVTALGGFYDEKSYLNVSAINDIYSGEVIGYLLVAQNLIGITAMWRSIAAMFAIIAGAVLIFTVYAALITAKKQAAPLSKMANAARNFARGDFSERIGRTGRNDEVEELAEAFDAMADSLEKAEKQRREFIANVSHELKTPMTTISGFAEGILDGTVPAEKREEYLKTISSECQRLSRLVVKMLDVTRMQEKGAEERKESFDIVELLVQVLLSLEGKINSRGLDVDMQLPEEAVLVTANSDSITQVIYNLIDNAVKFAEKGGTLGVSLWKSGKKANVSIRNTGQDIAPEELPLIFDRFHKADSSRSMDKDGAGLGLYIVKTILNNHGEDIFVTSENGITEFTFTLALTDNK